MMAFPPNYPPMTNDMTARSTRCCLALALVAAVVATGCGSTETPLTPVEGVVNLNGKPLPGVQVEFAPVVEVGSPRLPFSKGLTDANGRFTLVCENNKPGAVVGKHKVVVRQPVRPRSEGAQAPKPPAIPRPYQSLEDTPLTLEVTTDKGEYVVALKNR
jgi:hypothetical protein